MAVRSTGEDHRATPVELFFDLVYVFATTQLTGSMARERDANGVFQGLLMLALQHPSREQEWARTRELWGSSARCRTDYVALRKEGR
nr:low temperature requirement protein A [Microtetraspora sp. NBRC 16547]